MSPPSTVHLIEDKKSHYDFHYHSHQHLHLHAQEAGIYENVDQVEGEPGEEGDKDDTDQEE